MRQASLLLVLLLSAAAAAREYAPRVVSPQRADAYSMKTFAQFPRWRGLRGDALAWEVYQYLADTHSGLFHMQRGARRATTCLERVPHGPRPGEDHQRLRLRLLRHLRADHGGRLGRHGPGPGPHGDAARLEPRGLRGLLRRQAGTTWTSTCARSSAATTARWPRSTKPAATPSLWKNRGPLFFPNDPLDKTRQIYQQTSIDHYHGFNQSGHTMDYVLRQGETFTRWWTPQGGRWHHPPEYNREDWLRRLIEQEPRGPKPNHRALHGPQPRQRPLRLPAEPDRASPPISPTAPTTSATCSRRPTG